MESKVVNTIDKEGQTITFYSYKGGVGRSMALVNMACLLAKEGKKILLIDCDLEAPGLHQFFKTDEEKKGFIDLVTDIDDWTNTKENNDEEGYCRFMENRITDYISKDVQTEQTETNISLDLIKAGKFDKEYSKKLASVNWLNLYKKAPALFRTFAYCLEKDYDYIFIDARTGLADTSGICTMLLPQKLVLVFALNNQNINGVVDVAGQAIEYRFKSHDYRNLNIYPLPSRIENSSIPNLQEWINNYSDKFKKLFEEKYLLDECNLKPYFDRSFIPYYAIHAYGENIPSLYENVDSGSFITYNYNNFLTVLKKNIPAWEIISIEEEIKNERLSNEYFKKGYDYAVNKNYEAAIEEYSKAIEINQDFFDAYNNRGIAKHELNKHEEAITDFNMAIKLNPDYDLAYSNRANSLSALKRFEEARLDNKKAVELNPEYAKSYVGRGIMRFSNKIYEESTADYLNSQTIEPASKKSVFEMRTLKIFISSFSELKEERNKCISIINQLNKTHKHLNLEPVLWESDPTSENLYFKESIVNPKLLECDLAVFLFYSKIGKYTKEEFELAGKMGIKLFAYFKHGFTPKKQTLQPFGELLEFKENLNDRILYKEYTELAEFENSFFISINLFLSENYPIVDASLENENVNKLSTTNLELIRLLSEKEKEIMDLKKDNSKLSVSQIEFQLEQLLKEKTTLELQLSSQKENSDLKTKALEEIGKGNYELAESYLKKSSKESIDASSDTFYQLAKVKKAQLQHDEALKYYELATKINPENSLYLNEAGIMANDLGYYDNAIEYYQRALEIDKKYYAGETPIISTYYNNLGSAFASKGEYDKAINYYESSLKIGLKYYGENHSEIALLYNNLGSAYYSKAEFDKALTYYQKALEIDLLFSGQDNPQISSRYNNLGSAYNAKAEFDKALNCYQKALEIELKYYGEENPRILASYTNLGFAHRSKGEYDMAIDYYEKSLKIGFKYYGEEHPEIAALYNNIGEIYRVKGVYNKAIEYYERALKIDLKFYGEEHPDIAIDYNNLGSTYNSMGIYNRAIDYYKRSLSNFKKFLPDNHPNVQTVIENLEFAKQAESQSASSSVRRNDAQ